MFVLVLNASNVENNGNNNTLVYNFPNSISLNNKYVAVSQVVMYYAWFNVMSMYANNKFSYTWTVGNTTTTYDVNIPDGLYNISDINNYLQYVMISNGHYLITPGGDNVYYAEMLVNPNRYAIQINTFLVPSSLPTGYVQPSNFAGFPTTPQNPVITINSKLNEIIGYSYGFTTNNNLNNAYIPPIANVSNNYVSKDNKGTLSYLSNTNPDVQPNSSIYISISNINNPYTQPSSIIYAITPKVGIGELITETPPNFMWNKMTDGTYSSLRITLLGINKQPIQMKDKNMTILLTIRDKDELL